MATNKKTKLQLKDWAMISAIIVLFLAVVLTNWVWYEYSKMQDITNRNTSSAWLMNQVQINKLKACIDEGTKPCDITPPEQ